MRLFEQLEEVGTRLIDLLNAHLKHYKIVAYEQVMSILALFISKFLLLATLGISSVFFSFWLAYFLGDLLHYPDVGFLIVGFLYLMIGLIVHANREKWIIDPIVRELGKLIEKQNEDEDEEEEEE